MTLRTSVFFVSRNVFFHENIFPFHQVTVNDDILDPFPDLVLPKSFSYDGFSSQQSAEIHQNPVVSTTPVDNVLPDSDDHGMEVTCPDQSSTCVEHPCSTSPNIPLNLRRSTREKKQPSYLKDFHCDLLKTGSCFSTAIKFPLQNYISYNRLSPDYKNFVLNVSSVHEPRFYHEAVPHKH